MALTVNTNIASLNAQRNLSTNQSGLASVFERLSSGLRVNSAKDDAAGLAVAEGLSAIIRGSNVAIRNANDGISLGQTAEASLGQIVNNLQRIREIAVQSANGTISNDQRSNLQKEVDQLTQEIARTVSSTQFNGTSLLSGGATISFQIGASGSDTLSLSGGNLSLTSGFTSFSGAGGASGGVATNLSAAITATGTVFVSTLAGSSGAIAKLDTDISFITAQRATFGAVQNRFDAVINNLSVYTESLTAARGRIVDADFAAETAALTRGQILQQAATAILAQANALPQNALTLLR
jgi:flagellin